MNDSAVNFEVDWQKGSVDSKKKVPTSYQITRQNSRVASNYVTKKNSPVTSNYVTRKNSPVLSNESLKNKIKT